MTSHFSMRCCFPTPVLDYIINGQEVDPVGHLFQQNLKYSRWKIKTVFQPFTHTVQDNKCKETSVSVISAHVPSDKLNNFIISLFSKTKICKSREIGLKGFSPGVGPAGKSWLVSHQAKKASFL